eukprot:1490805-Rhodomonas_salina.2
MTEHAIWSSTSGEQPSERQQGESSRGRESARSVVSLVAPADGGELLVVAFQGRVDVSGRRVRLEAFGFAVGQRARPELRMERQPRDCNGRRSTVSGWTERCVFMFAVVCLY